MSRQTFIIHINRREADHDFYRVSCKKIETAMRYLKNWYEFGQENYCFRHFYRDGATYQIVETPNGYHEGAVVKEGLMNEFQS